MAATVHAACYALACSVGIAFAADTSPATESRLRETLARSPNALDARLALARLLADTNRTGEALALVAPLESSQPPRAEVFKTLAYVLERAQAYPRALAAYERAIALDERDAAARHARILVLSKMGATDAARTAAEQDSTFPAAGWQILHEDEAAQALVRAERAYAQDPRARFAELERVITLLDANTSRYPASLRTRFDRLRALQGRGRNVETAATYAALARDKVEMPAYVHKFAGRAYLALREPEAALAAFERAQALDKDDHEIEVGLFQALSDLTRYDDATTVIERAAARKLPPKEKHEVELDTVWARAYRGDLPAAEAGFDDLLKKAPSSPLATHALGRTYYWRGWPRRAEEQFERALALDDRSIADRIGRADVDRALGDHVTARAQTAELVALAPEDRDVLQLARRQRVHDGWELQNYAGADNAKDNLQKGRSLYFITTLFGPPIADQWRLFARQHFERNKDDDLTVTFSRVGGGLEYTLPRFGKLLGEVRRRTGEFGRTSGAGAFESNFDDHFSVDVIYDGDSADTPFRARADGEYGQLARAVARYRVSERLGFSAGVQQIRISDGNNLRGFNVRGTAVVYEQPFYRATVIAEFEGASASRQDVDYFSPEQSSTALLTLKNSWLGYRRYEDSLSHHLYLSAGSFSQTGFSAKPVWGARFEQSWDLRYAFNWSWSVGYTRRYFDSVASSGADVRSSLKWRF